MRSVSTTRTFSCSTKVRLHFQIGKSLTASRLHAENRFEQQRGFILELDSLINWLTDFISHSSSVDRQVNEFLHWKSSTTTFSRLFYFPHVVFDWLQQTIQLALNERQHHFDELLKCQFFHNQKTKEKIEHLVQMWLKLSSMGKNILFQTIDLRVEEKRFIGAQLENDGVFSIN